MRRRRGGPAGADRRDQRRRRRRAVAAASARDPRIAALVVFYGFIPNGQHARIDRLPPLLLLHGDADDNVPLLFGQTLLSFARQLGGRAELVVYPGEGHRTS